MSLLKFCFPFFPNGCKVAYFEILISAPRPTAVLLKAVLFGVKKGLVLEMGEEIV